MFGHPESGGRCCATTTGRSAAGSGSARDAVAERMAAGAACCGWLVGALRGVARDAGGAIVARSNLVSGVAARASIVTLDAVEPGSCRGCVTARARRGDRDPAWTMGSVTARAGDVGPVTARGLGRVAGRAGRGRADVAGVRFVARRAGLMAARRAAGLVAVTRGARRDRRRRCVSATGVAGLAASMAGRDLAHDGSVTARARGDGARRLVRGGDVAGLAACVARARAGLRLRGVAARAQRWRDRGLRGVGRVAVEALRGRVARLVVAALARHGELSRRERVRWVAARARGRRRTGRGRRRMLDALSVAARARRRGAGGVRRVTARARGVLRRGEHARGRVAARACERVVAAEPVRRVARGALRMGTEGARIDPHRSSTAAGLPRVAAFARGVGDELGLVHRVTVEATTWPPMLGRAAVSVARYAVLDLERRRTVRTMAVRARHVAMRADRRDVEPLRLLVAAQAGRRPDRQVRSEPVTVLARGRGGHPHRADRRVQRTLDVAVALVAQARRRDVEFENRSRRRSRRGERRCGGAVADARMTITARHVRLGDVHGVSRAGADLLPRPRHLGRFALVPPATRDEHRDREEQPRRRHLAPIG